MGYFSFKTSDTKRSIWNTESGRKVRTVFMLQPNGLPPIREDAYEGYGEFGGVDCYEWLGTNNLPAEKLKGVSADDIRSMGVDLDCGQMIRAKDGQLVSIFHDRRLLFSILGIDVIHFDGTWETKIPGYGKTGNEMVKSGEAERVSIKELVGGLKFPLKFSFKESAKYEDLPEALPCPNQGFFS